jgi:hypothetical protein
LRAEHKFRSAQKRHSKGRTKKEIQRMAQMLRQKTATADLQNGGLIDCSEQRQTIGNVT